MGQSLIQSALVLPKVPVLPFGTALKPGVTLTVPNPLGGILVENGTAVYDGMVDVIGYATRDRELQYRDIAVAQAIELIARRAATVFNANFSFAQVPVNPDVFTAETLSGTLAIGAAQYTTTLANVPVARGRMAISIGAVSTVDDGQGNVVANGIINGGSIDYVGGTLVISVIPNTAKTLPVVISWLQVQYLQSNTVDLNPNQPSNALGGATGVEYVDNSNVPQDAALTDQDLYRRDLALYEVLTVADQIFVQLQNAWSVASASPTIPTTLNGTTPISGVTLNDAWSQALADGTLAMPGFGQRWSPDVYADADQYLAWRDNVLAAYAAELSSKLASVLNATADLNVLSVIGSENPIIVNASQHLPDDPIPPYPDPSVTTTDTPQALRPMPPTWLVNYNGYFAPLQTANRLLLRVSDSQVDSYVAPNTSNLNFQLGSLQYDYVGGVSTPVLRFNDTEYTSLDGNVAQARLPRNEAEVYLLTTEDTRYRTFTAYPTAGNSARTLVYDKLLATIRWYPHSPQDVMVPQPAGPTVIGTRPTQSVQLLGSAPYGLDAEYWRQKAAQVQATQCHERSSQYLNFPTQSGIPSTYAEVSAVPVVLSTQAGIFTLAGAFRFESLYVYALARAAQSQWMQFNFLVTPARSWYRHSNTWNQTASSGAISVNSSGMFLPPANATNSYQLPTNVPQAVWNINVPSGAYNLFFEWYDVNSAPVPLNFTVRWNGQIIFTGPWLATAPNALGNSPVVQFFAASSATGTISLTWDSPVTSTGVFITRLNFALVGNAVPAEYALNATFYDNDSSASLLNQMPGQNFRFLGMLGVPEVLSTDWIDIAQVDQRTVMNAQLAMLDQPDIALALTGVEVRTRIKIDPMSNWEAFQPYKDQCLAQALSSIQSKYASRAQATEIRAGASPNYTWTATTTSGWLAPLAYAEPRLNLAFRQARPGDVGRPALVPAGVYFNGTGIVALNGPLAAIPTLSPWQPWMAPLNFPVAMEDFWTVEQPAKPVQLIVVDPTGEDVITYDPYAPNLDFSKSADSMYIPLI